MPVVEVDPDELRNLTGVDKSDQDLIDDLFALGLELEGRTEEGALELEFAPDRLDRLSVEGIARSLRYQYGMDRGVDVPNTNEPDWTIEVDENVPEQRPYVTGAIARNVDLDENTLTSLIQLQEKLHATMGRQRKKGAIGIHDLTMLKGESLTEATSEEPAKRIKYTGIAPDEDKFVPLESSAEMTPETVIREHPTGQEYGSIVENYDRMPAIYDDIGLFSFPPVINGRRTEVTTKSRDLFIEMTGTDQWTIDRMLSIVCYALAARGATIEEVNVEYDSETTGEYAGSELARPDLSTREKTVTHDRIETIVGVDFDPEEVIDLFERSGLSAVREETDETVEYTVEIPSYRTDVLHPVDLIDDVGRAYGFNKLDPKYPDVSTVGERHERSRHEEAVRRSLVGLGFEDMLNFHMINEEENFRRMSLPIPDSVSIAEGEIAIEEYRENEDQNVEGITADMIGIDVPPTIKEPYSEEYTTLRTWVLPSLLMVLERNTHREYPQNLAEIGFTAGVDPRENTGVSEQKRVGGVLASNEATYEKARGRLQALANLYDLELRTPATAHPTFIEGRVADIVLDGNTVGVIGEIHPSVLTEHNLEVPVAAFEFELEALK
ncbi:phenylalanine--tRNA ligase subunit beta [Salinarchaeum sp. IM2453]|uniref:phenylalanine--tRNA ligase subunit beta n=1 Tax=Salinarchaeum sp. IM2453 TaxID=2862870 RepID=UPI001C829865|nr:phenylalanine--tRNA ligase subunit beta [Salinarchaeum sp. IM2453]QZA87540.1 phenylalanine--tRNA ligase subunit beta [Salinarchaeum sp. IM2453]